MATMKKFLMMVLTAACMLGVLAQAQEVSANANIVFNADVGVYVPAGGSHGHVFHIHNPNCRAYNGTIRWHVDNHIRFS